ncbi:MAG: glycosyltransferase N-terminal domain-containing protein [Flavobacteriales bacterium]|nr:MAG: glycosyltransferase N-terminal domain-containing protein [Flavobacteriales bacterium]
MPLLYDLGLGLYHAGIRLAAPFHPKARRWVAGRHGLWERLQARRSELNGCLWMHCASVGEFEQGLPVLEALKADRPDLPVLVTFFSPSGYEARRHHPIATHVEYLPADGAARARRMIGLVQPKAVLWVKYEFWYHWLSAFRRARVPVFLVSGIFRPEQPFFRWWGRTHRRMLACFERLFVQDEASRDLLATIGVGQVTVSGDTRYDRVDAIARTAGVVPIGKAFQRAMEGPVLIAGSTWPQDEQVIATALGRMSRPPRLLLVPHELDEAGLQRAERMMPKPVVRWSHLEELLAAPSAPAGDGPPDEDPLFARTLLVDRMGLLARLYQHGSIAYVGGGFGDGIHSTLEAAAWGLPILFGPEHRKFAEAKALLEAGGAREVRDAEGLQHALTGLIQDAGIREAAAVASLGVVREGVGATRRIAAAVAPFLG